MDINPPAVALVVFVGSVAVLAYVYVGFPLLVLLWGAVRPRRVHIAAVTPRVSLIIAAHNEAASATAKVQNCLDVDYPPAAIEVVFASDGSTDRTEEIVRRFAARGVRLLSLPRQGKLAAVHAAVEASTGEILVFSDANTYFHPDAVRMLARNFADPAVGGVCGNLQVRSRDRGRDRADSSGAGESWYWELDKALKRMQSRSGSIVAADGAIYAIRRHLYTRPEHTAVTDDFAISTGVVARGYRLVFEPEALAWEPSAGRAGLEFSRKVRIVNRGLRGVLLRRQLLNPRRYGFYAVILFSHKVLRRVAPLFLMSLLASTLALAAHGTGFAIALYAQLAFYATALAGWMLRGRAFGRQKLLLAPFYYCLANAAALAGLCSLATGQRIERWEPQRTGAAS